MSEIKEGDWVYWTYRGDENVFKCTEIKDDRIYHGDIHACVDNCHLLTPLEPGEALEIGTRCVVIADICGNRGKIKGVPSIGDIVTLERRYFEGFKFHLIVEEDKSFCYAFDELARLPDCAQRQNCTSGVALTKDEFIRLTGQCEEHAKQKSQRATGFSDPDEPVVLDEMGDMPYDELPSMVRPRAITGASTPTVKPLPCPNPEWEGVWMDGSNSRKIEWFGSDECSPAYPWWIATVNAGRSATYAMGWPGPESEGWTQLEPAPTQSTAGPKLQRPAKHGALEVPWDPYGEG